jgi:hypothetical protein
VRPPPCRWRTCAPSCGALWRSWTRSRSGLSWFRLCLKAIITYLAEPVVVDPLLTFPILPFFSLSLSTASRRKPHIVKFSGDYALRARLPMGSAQPATSVAGPSFAGRSGHNCSTLAATPRRTAALRPPEPPTKPPPPQPPPTELPPTEPPHPRAAKCSRSASQRRTRARATVTRIRMR